MNYLKIHFKIKRKILNINIIQTRPGPYEIDTMIATAKLSMDLDMHG